MAEKPTMPFLVVVETQKVKSYLFASPIMRETRGASARMDWLNRKMIMELLEKQYAGEFEKIYLGGGSGRILFRNEPKALEFKDKVVELYRKETVNARVSVEVLRRLDGENFADWMRRGVAQSQRNKLGRIEGVPVLAGRWIMPCTSCGTEPAEHLLSHFGEHRLCRSCMLKREEIDKHLYVKIKEGESYKPRCLKSPQILTMRYTKEFVFVTLGESIKNKKGMETVLPQTFNSIGDRSKPANYMGLIYADGNRMGETVKKMAKQYQEEDKIKQAYAAFSEIVDQATREAAVEAVLKNLDCQDTDSHEGKAKYVPAEFIMAGGDDLVLAVPAHNALETAIDFMKMYQEKTKSLQKERVDKQALSEPFAPDGLTTSAGVVIAHAHYPVSDLMTMAGDLMKIAKKKAVKSDVQTGTVDFMILSESNSERAKYRRNTEYFSQSMGDEPEIRRTERPYTASDASRLVDTIRAFKRSRVPRTKIKALYPAVFRSSLQARFDSLRILHRLKTAGFLEPEKPLGEFANSFSHFPFREQAREGEKAVWTSPITEIVELYDFIRPADKANQAPENVAPETEASHA